MAPLGVPSNDIYALPFKLFKVGPSEPRTKPKALNSALETIPETSHDDIITIYDAEDRPHPYQLKAAALALSADPELAAVQAPLGYYNDNRNLLTRFFSLEYAALFHVWNPALYHLHLPFTLGGTSNHIRRSVVESVGGWDSHNVTEDADLSFKINALSQKNNEMKIGCIAYGTQEEAVDNYTAWIHQRSRWLKGFFANMDCAYAQENPQSRRKKLPLKISHKKNNCLASHHWRNINQCLLTCTQPVDYWRLIDSKCHAFY